MSLIVNIKTVPCYLLCSTLCDIVICITLYSIYVWNKIYFHILLMCKAFVCCCKSKKVSLCLIKHQGMKMHGGVEVVLDGNESSFSHPGHFTPWERAPSAQGIGCWVSPRASLDAMGKRKISCPCQESSSNSPVI
jgi:hypothetical protein